MGPAPDPITGALLALRLLAVADAPDVAERSGWPQPDIDRVLAHLDESGWARYRPGRFPGWMLTGHGRAEGEPPGQRRPDERAAAGEQVFGSRGFPAAQRDHLGAEPTKAQRECCGRRDAEKGDGHPPHRGAEGAGTGVVLLVEVRVARHVLPLFSRL